MSEPQKFEIVSVRIPFWNMMVLIIKFCVAAVPALLFLAAIWVVVSIFVVSWLGY